MKTLRNSNTLKNITNNLIYDYIKVYISNI